MPLAIGLADGAALIEFQQPSPFLHPRTVRATVVVLLALLAALLHFPRLRHAAGQALLGWLFVAVMARFSLAPRAL
jgi:multisubunit Na+/H+ antiporter MnhG subunit